jgi:hypothetical protein
VMIYGIEWCNLSPTTKICRFAYIYLVALNLLFLFGELMVLFFNFISHMLQQRRENILISLLCMRLWSRYFFHQLKLLYYDL